VVFDPDLANAIGWVVVVSFFPTTTRSTSLAARLSLYTQVQVTVEHKARRDK